MEKFNNLIWGIGMRQGNQPTSILKHHTYPKRVRPSFIFINRYFKLEIDRCLILSMLKILLSFLFNKEAVRRRFFFSSLFLLLRLALPLLAVYCKEIHGSLLMACNGVIFQRIILIMERHLRFKFTYRTELKITRISVVLTNVEGRRRWR